MKRLSILLLWMIISFFAFPREIYAVSVADFTPILDKKVASMKTTKEKVEYLRFFSDSLNATKYTKSKDAWLYQDIQKYIQNMLRVFEYELQEEQINSFTQVSSKIGNLPHMSNNLQNIDVQKVREAVLSWHNEERKNVWVNSYTYNLDLEWSATVWANKLVESGKTKNLHLRNSWDWYYNYNSLLNRFSGLWIKFPKSVKWGASFSETIWRNVYRCSKYDCTQDLIDAVKKTWTGLIMKEKTSNGSHYRAAVMKHFTQMWAWIAIDKSNNRYYLVLHYGVEF